MRSLVLLVALTLPLALAGCRSCLEDLVEERIQEAQQYGNASQQHDPNSPWPGATPAGDLPEHGETGFYRPDRRLEARRDRNEVPQVRGRWDLFAELKDGPVDPATGGLLVCDLRLPGTPWYASRPDMEAALTLGGHPTMYLVGEDNRDATVVTAPIPALAAGDAVKLVVEDRDLIGRNDHLDQANSAYSGAFPMLLVGDARELHATCRGMRAPEVQRRLAPAKRDADATLQLLSDALKPDPAAPDWGYPWQLQDDAEAAIEQVPALVGWRDPAVKPLLQRLDGIKADWDRDARASVDRAKAGATPTGTTTRAPGGRVDVAVRRTVCDAAVTPLYAGYGLDTQYGVPTCVVELALLAPVSGVELPSGVLDADVRIPGAGKVEVVLPAGHTEELRLQAWVRGGAQVTPAPTRVEHGTELVMVLAQQSDYGNGSALSWGPMLRVEGGASPLFLLLR